MNTVRPVTFDVLCGEVEPAQAAIRRLESQGFCFDATARLKVIIDIERGFALRTLVRLEHTDLRLVVLTYSFCPEYWEDLWDLRPCVLLVDRSYDHDLAEVLLRTEQGDCGRITPENPSRLTPAQRRVLQLVAHGWTNKQIATFLSLQEKSVLNILTAIYQRLQLQNRTQATLYYWGIGCLEADDAYSKRK